MYAINSVDNTLSPAVVKKNFPGADRKSTRLNSSHSSISYAVFCLKKKKKQNKYFIRLTTIEQFYICEKKLRRLTFYLNTLTFDHHLLLYYESNNNIVLYHFYILQQ